MRRRAGEEGFVLLETLVAISLISVIMGAFTTFFVNSVAFTSEQRATQIATQIANSAVDTIRALPASDRIKGHDLSSVTNQFDPTKVSSTILPWLLTMAPALDATVPAPLPGTGLTAAVPTTAVAQTINSVIYNVNVFLGTCAIPNAGLLSSVNSAFPASCVRADTAVVQDPISYMRAVVAVTWTGSRCPPNKCTYVTSTLLSTIDDPLFSPVPVPPPLPILDPIPDQTSAVLDADINLLPRFTAMPSWRFAITVGTLPAGLSLDTATGVISSSAPLSIMTGVPIPLTLTLTDGFGRQTSVSFTWTVVAALTATKPENPSTEINADIAAITVTANGGTPGTQGYIWSAANLPPGISISSQGVITGKPTSVGPFPQPFQVVLTVTDRKAPTPRSATVNFTWTVKYPPISATPPVLQKSTTDTWDTLTLTATGGSGSFTWTGGETLPPGLLLVAATGVISGIPTIPGTTEVTTNVVLVARDKVTGFTQDVKFSWTVYPKPTVASPVPLIWNVGESVSLQLTTCPNTNCTYVLTNGPAGVGIDASSGEIKGTLTTAQTLTIATVTVTDASGAIASGTFAVTVNGPRYGAYWKFDEGTGTNATDSTGDGNTGTLKSGATWTTGKIGLFAVSLTRANSSFVDIPSTAIDTGQSYTVSAWVKPSSLNGNQTFVSIDGTKISPFYLQMVDGRFTFTVHSQDATNSARTPVAAGTSATVDVWYHLVGIYDNVAHTITLYVNGVLQSTASFSSPWKATGHTTIGRAKWNGGPVDFVDGAVDDVRMESSAVYPAPIAQADTYAVNVTTLTVPAATGVLANDTARGDMLSAILVSTTTNGALTLTANGGFTYTPNPMFNGSDSFTYKANDGSHDSNTVTVTLTVIAVNNPPVNSVPGAQQTPKNTNLVFATASHNLISISDPDAGAANVQVTLTATAGTITLPVLTDLSFSAGDGTTDATMTFTGTIANINLRLAGMTFIPNNNVIGAATVAIATNDQGNTGTGGSLTDTDSVPITINPFGIFSAQADIGGPGQTGSTLYSAGTYTVKGGGTDIWNTSDQFQFAYMPWTGDGTLTAHVVSQAVNSGTNPAAKAGVMMRETVAAGSKLGMMDVKNANGSEFIYRLSANSFPGNNNTAGIPSSYWVRITRIGNVFTGQLSSNGTVWTQQGTSQTITMVPTIYVGLAVSAVDITNTKLNTAVFDHVTMTP